MDQFFRPPTVNIKRDAARLGFADEMHESLAKVIAEFQEQLADDEEVGCCLASFGQQITIRITAIGYENPHVMKFCGIAPDGKNVTLLQHTSQVNLLLTPLKATERPAHRIGFAAKVEE